ncbi:MAG: hypothetical protein ACREAK_02085 [Nitrosarchaeum sp.]
MVNIGKPHVGDIQTDFQLLVEETDYLGGGNTPVDLSLTTTQYIIFTDPNGVETQVTASILNPPGTDGLIRYIDTTPSLLTIAGIWKYRARLIFTTGGEFSSNDAVFEVL